MRASSFLSSAAQKEKQKENSGGQERPLSLIALETRRALTPRATLPHVAHLVETANRFAFGERGSGRRVIVLVADDILMVVLMADRRNAIYVLLHIVLSFRIESLLRYFAKRNFQR